jgi:hypothetical protein
VDTGDILGRKPVDEPVHHGFHLENWNFGNAFSAVHESERIRRRLDVAPVPKLVKSEQQFAPTQVISESRCDPGRKQKARRWCRGLLSTRDDEHERREPGPLNLINDGRAPARQLEGIDQEPDT